MKAHLLLGVALTVLATPALAQTDPAAPATPTAPSDAGVPADAAAQAQADAASAPADAPAAQNDQQDIVVTGVARGVNRLDSSISTSSISDASLVKLAPRSTAEALRNLPGIRVEASGGEGNANISVRGLPVASGGSKFLQLQEDGLPVLEFGDITFGNSDIFIRNDLTLGRVESVRGGSASTFASNSPGGIINFISKTGEQDGGSFMLTSGLDYRDFRSDFAYGGHIDENTRFELGGFYRIGDGARHVGYDAMRGGQIRANITRTFDGGYVRIYGKYLDDRGISYLPNPVRVTGSNSDPDYSNLAGFSINQDTLQSRYIDRMLTLDGNNQPTVRNISDGMHPVVKSAGLETQVEVAKGWTVTERFRYADISGNFVSPFPSSVGSAQSVANAFAGTGSQLYYASGPSTGQRIANPATLGGNGLLASVVLFDVDLNKLDNITNDIRINGDVALAGGTLSLTGGFYKSRQDINTDWLWTSYFQTVQGDGQSVLVDIRNAAGVAQTQNGVAAYSASFFGNCCRRSYDVHYDTNAPFAQAGWQLGRLNLDASVRYDFGYARGTIAGSDIRGTGIETLDLNGDGVISAPERQVAFIPASSRSPVDYNYDYFSYSFGANYRLLDSVAVFARYSRGGRANADRLLFGPAVSTTTGALLNNDAAVDFVRQVEGGVKYRQGPASLYVTVFHANTEEQNFEATTQRFFDRTYRATGVEAEGSYRMGPFSLTAGGTYTDAKIASDAIDATVVGNQPRRQARFIYQATPQVDVGRFTVGANVIGTTSSYTQDTNQLKLPGYTQVNAFLSVRPADKVTVMVNGNNLFNVAGYTEAEDAAIPTSGIVRARSINGRTVSAAVRFDF